MVVENQETILTCEYCGAQTKVLWKEGMIPNCEACGAPLRIDLQDKGQEPVYAAGTGGETTRARRGISPAKIILLIFAVMVVLRIIGNFVINNHSSQSVSNVQEQPHMDDSIYVDEIGRTCYLDGDNYYDEETQCWFWYNEERSVWQYWYEGISSDYGDYGWMEYDYTDQKWYIETSQGKWEELPAKYSTDRLWHFGQSQAGSLTAGSGTMRKARPGSTGTREFPLITVTMAGWNTIIPKTSGISRPTKAGGSLCPSNMTLPNSGTSKKSDQDGFLHVIQLTG